MHTSYKVTAALVIHFTVVAVSSANSVCEDVLKHRAFNTVDFSTSTSIYTNEYNKVCLNEYKTVEKAKAAASNSSFGATFKGIPLNLGHAKQNSSGYYSLEDTKYCKTLKNEIHSQSQQSYNKTMTDIAVRAWETCIGKVHGNSLFVRYNPSFDGASVSGTLIRTVGDTGGFGNITSISSTGFSNSDTENSSDGTLVQCKIGGAVHELDTQLNIPIIKTHTNFSCTRSSTSLPTVISINTNQGDVDVLMPSFAQKEHESKIIDLTRQIERKIEEVSLLDSEVSSLKEKLRESNNKLSNLERIKPSSNSMFLRGTAGGHELKFESMAFPESNKVVITMSFLGAVSDSCTFTLTNDDSIIGCDKRISAAPGNNFHIEGDMRLDQSRGIIRFTGMALISNVLQTDFKNAIVLVSR